MFRLKPLSGSILVDCTLLLSALYILACLRSYYRLKHIPGPKLWAWSVFPLFGLHLQGEIYDKFADLDRDYGPLVRVAPNMLLTSDADVLRRMSSARSPYTRSDWFLGLRVFPGDDNVLSTRNEKRHDELRRMMSAGYSGKENVFLESDIDQCVLDLVNLIGRKYISTPEKFVPMDLAQKIQYFTVDVISKLSSDENKFRDVDDDNDNFGYIAEIGALFPNLFWMCTVPKVIEWLTNIGIMKLFAPSRKSKRGLGKVVALMEEQVSKRFNAEGKLDDKPDMHGSFIRHGMKEHEVVQESILQLAAGSDTTATGLRATLLCIITNPPVYQRLLTEIDTAVASGKIPSSTNEIISDEQARQLPYLQACIKEGLRWYPPIASELPKKVPPAGDLINGYFVPGGVDIGYSTKAVHRSAALFGPDANVFRPERWILTEQGGGETSAEKLKAMERNNDLIFGYGKYQCLGKNVAMIELNKVFVEFFRRFQITVIDPSKVWTTRCYGIHLQREMWVTVRKRSQECKQPITEVISSC